MPNLKDLVQQSKHVHERKIEVRSYPQPDGNLVVEGWLRDERKVPIHHWSGNMVGPGVVHHMAVRLLIGGWPIRILEAEAEMPGIPREMCIQTQETVQNVVGVSIVSGYSDEIKKRLGGIKGCTHLTHLIVVMGPAALHGFWTHAARNPMPQPKSLEEVPGLSLLVNSCQLWAENGPFMTSIKEEIERRTGGAF
jgi:hypothetical protein